MWKKSLASDLRMTSLNWTCIIHMVINALFGLLYKWLFSRGGNFRYFRV